MKNFKFLTAFLGLTFVMNQFVSATDLVVEEFGTPPAYSSITAAVNAAVDGDRIIIRNRAGNIPWIENITLNKSLELLSYDNDTFFVVQGTYTIDAAAGRTISIIGMKNLSGSILYGISSGANKTTTVNIFDSYFVSGRIVLNPIAFVLNLAGSTLDDGIVNYAAGSVFGNSIYNSTITGDALTLSNSSGYQSDTAYIIGNRIYNNNSGYNGINCASNASILHIKNNYIFHRYAGIQLNGCANVSIPNYIYNNTIWVASYSFSNYGIYLSSLPGNSITEVMNNVIDGNAIGTKYGLYSSALSGQLNAYFNHIDVSFNTAIAGSFTFSGSNTSNLGIAFNTATGVLNAGDACIDGGNPANPFYDLDLTPGDAGAYGASYSMDNFFPLHTGSARVYSVMFPFNIRSGNTLNIKASGYDR